MSGRHKFSDLEAAMPPARRARIDRLAHKLSEDLDRLPKDLGKKINYEGLHELREARVSRPDWKSEVRQCIIKLGDRAFTQFTLHDMYLFVPELSARTGRNRGVDARIRENLQKLRDDGFIRFLDNQGSYCRIR